MYRAEGVGGAGGGEALELLRKAKMSFFCVLIVCCNDNQDCSAITFEPTVLWN